MREQSALQRFREAITDLTSLPAHALTRDELRNELPRLVDALGRADAVVLRLMREADERGSYDHAHTGVAGWLAATTHWDTKQAQQAWWLSTKLDTHPQLQDAYDNGRIGNAHAAMIAQFLDHHTEHLAATPPTQAQAMVGQLLDQARHPDSRQLRALLRCHTDHLTATTTTPDEGDTTRVPDAENRELNRFRLRQLRNGRFTYHASVDSLTGDALATAVAALNRKVTQPDGSPDPRDQQQRDADAMETIIRHYLDNGHAPTDGGERPHIHLHIRPQDLTHDHNDQTTVDILTLIRDANRHPTNLVLLCHRHHYAVHHEGWVVEITEFGFPQFHPPARYGRRPPVPANHRYHIVIDGRKTEYGTTQHQTA